MTFFNKPLSISRCSSANEFSFGNRGFYASAEGKGNACLNRCLGLRSQGRNHWAVGFSLRFPCSLAH
jgi:hypothetical protein